MLVHFSRYADITSIQSCKQNNDVKSSPWVGIGKPRGFWVSDEGRGDGWLDWCKDEDFRLGHLRYRYEVKLANTAKILYIHTPQELDEFTEKYTDVNNPINKMMRDTDRVVAEKYPSVKWASHHDTMYIDWEKVAREYQGIIITPYIYSRRILGPIWYYTWDCASGCIWDAAAIESITRFKGRIPSEL